MPRIINQHIPKSGSTSTKNFYPKCIVYGHMQNLNKLNAEIPEDSISFTILREPLARFISNITYFCSRKVKGFTKQEMIDLCLDHNYTNDEMAQILKRNNMMNTPEVNMAFHSISIFHPFLNVFDENKKLKATHLIDFNYMVRDLEKILPDHDYKKFPKSNSSRANIDVEMTEEQLEKFNLKYAEDIKFYKEVGF